VGSTTDARDSSGKALAVTTHEGNIAMKLRRLSSLPVLAFVVVVAGAVPRAARAQDLAAPPEPAVLPQATPQAATGPGTWLIDSGAAVFAASYLPAMVVGASSAQHADRALFAPIAGPWIDLAQLPPCTPGVVCASTAARGLVIVDGVFQVLGVASFIAGLMTPAPEPVQLVAGARSTLRIAPAQVGAGAYGMVAFGTF
jgi:hypothetical protein